MPKVIRPNGMLSPSGREKKSEAIARRTTEDMSQITICISPAAPSPITFPVNSCLAETEDNRISMSLFSFSSLTP